MSNQKTPTTNQEIREMHPDQWEEMKLPELQEELSALQDRLTMAYNLNMVDSIDRLQTGIEQLRSVIEQRFGTYASNTFLM